MEPLSITRDGPVTTLVLNRPDKLNALGTPVIAALEDVVDSISRDTNVRAVVVTGAGRAFSAGADIAEFGALESSEAFRGFIERLETALAALEALPQPVIAAVNGIAFGGGCELAMACDIRVAEEGVRLGLPEIKLGLLPGAGGTQRIYRLIPRGAALRVLMTGEPLMATEAHRLGLVDELVPPGESVNVAQRLAERLAGGPPLALAAAKRLVRDGASLPLRDAIVLERTIVSSLFETADRAEGVVAFHEKRDPRFEGR